MNYAVYLASMLVVLASNELPVIGSDAIFWAIIGMIGSFAGSLVRIAKRDDADVEDKIKFFYWKDVFKIIAWSLVGGFFPLAMAANGFYPWLVVLCSPFMPKVWDTMDEAVPGIIKTIVNRFVTNSNNNNSSNNNASATGNNSNNLKKETDGETK